MSEIAISRALLDAHTGSPARRNNSFIYLYHSQAQAIKAQRDALKERCDTLRKLPPGFSPWEKRLSDGQVTSQAERDFVFGNGQQIDLSAGLISDDENSRIYRETMKEAHWIKDRRIDKQ